MPDPNPEDLTLSITHHIAAPPATVWRVMTERLPEWFCPAPWRAEVIEQDWRAGGRSALVMHGPNGEAMPQEGIFLEVTPGVRFVFTDALDADWRPQGPFMAGTMEIAADGDGTRFTGTARHWTAEARDQHVAMGFEQGWATVARQLGTLAEAETQS